MKKRSFPVARVATIALASAVSLGNGQTAPLPANQTLWPTHGWATARVGFWARWRIPAMSLQMCGESRRGPARVYTEKANNVAVCRKAHKTLLVVSHLPKVFPESLADSIQKASGEGSSL
jgi:hypothetical protein